MPRVVALYRHPVKGFTPQRRDELLVQPDGRIAGDRVLAFRFADAVTAQLRDGLAYWPKAKGLALQDFPSLAALRLSYDDTDQRLRITHAGELMVDAALDASGRATLVDAVTDFVLASPEGTRLRHAGRMPLELVGDGERSRFQDRPRGYVSLHSTGSVTALGNALAQQVDDRRFRSNIVIDGVPSWDELSWNRAVTIAGVRFALDGPITRCLATHANPETGLRDARVLTALTESIGLDRPVLGRLLLLQGVSGDVDDRSGDGGVIRVGDELQFD